MENYVNKTEQQRTNLLPVIPLRGKVAFPHTSISFEVGREMTLVSVQRANEQGDKLVLICTQKVTEKDEINPEDLYDVGCVAKIKQAVRTPGGVLRVVCECLYRAKAREIKITDGHFSAVCDEIISRRGDELLEEAYFRTAKALLKDVLTNDGKIAKEIATKLELCADVEEFIDNALSVMRVKIEIKQESLQEVSVIKRLQLLERCLNDELEISKIEKKIASSVRQSIDKSQKEYFLREQLKAVHSELGDDGKEEDEYREKIMAKGLPDAMKEKCLKEVDRLQKMQSASPEYTVITGYLDQVLALPWTEETTDTQSLIDCEKTLDADHYGLEKIKERIVEYLAVLKRTQSMKAPILCFVGPPGVGKTSIAHSIARALGRKFVRMSLGGVKDEAEIRGHRRTYIGAMPGRILYGMKNAGSINPVFLLDEIDKIPADMHGDPSSALLEALDPEQNSTFRDRYLEMPYNLSKVMFITTANTLDTIAPALRDRMEIIQLSGYTLEEKVEIGMRYLAPKQRKENGLTEKDVVFTAEGMAKIIEGYTREAGVRSLERAVGKVCRKVAVAFTNGTRKTKIKITPKEVEKLLGAPIFTVDETALLPQVGAVNGLAWTALGGTTLTVEAVTAEGKGDLTLTGHLGDVMKESAQTALGYLRANARKYNLTAELFSKNNLHVHVPEGATPKDGPSAGITLATAILSAFTGAFVRGDVAMTGEITLRGRVLPIGGLKEKALAARRVGIKEIIIPVGNKKDVAELPKALLDDVKFIPVSTVDEVFEAVLLLDEKDKIDDRKKQKIAPLPIVPRNKANDSVRCKNSKK